MSSNLYDRDFYAWANEQAADIQIIAKEINSVCKAGKCELLSRLARSAD